MCWLGALVYGCGYLLIVRYFGLLVEKIGRLLEIVLSSLGMFVHGWEHLHWLGIFVYGWQQGNQCF